MQKRLLTAALSVALFSLFAPISMVHAETSFVIRIPTGVKLSPEITILLDARETLPVATVGASYRFDFRDRVVITGESSPDLSALSWSLLSPAPMGLALSADGVLSGVPLDEGTNTLELAVTYKGKNDSETFVIEVVLDAQVALSAGTPPAGLVGVPYAGFDPRPLLSVSGDPSFNMEAVTWSLKAGSVLPQGLALDPATGLISGTPSAVFSGPVALVANYKDVSGEHAYAFTIDLNIAVSLAVATAPQGIVGQGYAGFDPRPYLTVTGDPDFDLNAVSWSVASGALPAGLALNASTGVISGVPTAASNSTVTLRASYKGRNGAQSYSLVMMGIQVGLASATPPAGVIGQAYAGFDPRPLLSVTGDPAYAGANVSWSVKAGSRLPDGLTLDPTTGVVSGTPTAPFSDAVPLVATYRGVSGEQSYTFTVNFNVTMSMSVASAPQGVVGVAYPGFDLNDHLTVSGDPTFTSSAVTWSVASGTLPAGLTLNAATGVISGTPTAAASSSVTFKATYNGSTTQGVYSLVTLNIGVTLASASAPEGVVGVAYPGFNLRNYLTVTGDASFTSSTPVAWSVASGTLPAGLALNASTGVISGTPTTAGTSSVTFRASYKGKNGDQTYSLVTINIGVSLAAATAPEGVVGVAYAGFNLRNLLTVTGDASFTSSTPVAWSVASGALPAGLTLNTSTGVISGTPTTAGTSSVTFRATYKGKTGDRAYSLVTISIGVSLAAATAPEGVVGVAYAGFNLRNLLTVTGDASFTSSTPVAWSVASGTLPAGLALNASTGVISGTPTTAGTSSVTFRATYKGKTGDRAYSLVRLSIAVGLLAATPPAGKVGTAYTGFNLRNYLSVTGDSAYNVANVSWAVTSGTLPSGLSLNTSTGMVSGTPSSTYSGSVTFRASYRGVTGSRAYSFSVTAAEDYSGICWSTNPTWTNNCIAAAKTCRQNAANYFFRHMGGFEPQGCMSDAYYCGVTACSTNPNHWTGASVQRIP